MEQILFEIGVVARNARHAQRLGEFEPGIVGREGRLDMDEIGSVLAKQWQEFAYETPSHEPVLGVEGQGSEPTR